MCTFTYNYDLYAYYGYLGSEGAFYVFIGLSPKSPVDILKKK